MRRKRHGFSLVELLVSTLIISACYGGLAKVYTERRGAADNRACEQTRRGIHAALESWNATHGRGVTDLAQALPALILEGYVSRPAEPAGHFSYDGREVRCRVHPFTPQAPKPVEYPALWLPALMFVYAFVRFTLAVMQPRPMTARVWVPVMDPLSGPLSTTQKTAALVLCHFCGCGIARDIVKVDGKPMHPDCGAFTADEMER